MILLVASNKDPASQNIKMQLLKNFIFSKTSKTFEDNAVYTSDVNNKKVTFITLNRESVTAQDLPEQFPNTKLIVFISRHSSQSAKPTLTVHTPGNFGDAELGGLPKQLSVCPAVAMQTALKAMVHYQEQLHLFNYEISYEVTHHGPSLNVPTMFVELGSSPEQWGDVAAAEAVAHSAMTAIANFDDYSLHRGFRHRRHTLQPTIHLAFPYGCGDVWPHDTQIRHTQHRCRHDKAVRRTNF